MDEKTKKTEIVVTVGYEFFQMEWKDIREWLDRYKIQNIRVNLAKFETQDEIGKLKKVLLDIKKLTNSAINIMLDLPIPYKKVRFSLNNDQEYVDVREGEFLKITSAKSNHKEKGELLLRDEEEFLKEVRVGEKIQYADGECALLVTKKERNSITVIVQNQSRIYSKKSLHIQGKVVDNRCEIKKNTYTDLLQAVQPWATAFCFISTKQDVLDMKNYMKKINVKTEIISKIETIEGTKQIEDILEVSDVILARGDLSLNIPIESFFDAQKRIFEKVKKSGRKIYVATGILNSLISANMPTQSEIIDLTVILKNHPDGIILNYALSRSERFTNVLGIIERIKSAQ